MRAPSGRKTLSRFQQDSKDFDRQKADSHHFRQEEMMKMITKRQSVFLVTAAVSAVLAGAAVATPPSGILSGTVFARASFADTVDMSFKVRGADQEVIHVRSARETVMQQIVI